jgi:serine/threonine protein kinase
VFLLERFIDGPTLKEILKKRQGQPLPVGEALYYLKALCAALGFAHANGVVHCDVKPANLMVDAGGNVYLTDFFGSARHSESTSTTMGTVGTAAYMAPEQVLGKAVTPASDIYALGVTLFEMVVGRRPFRGNEAGTESAGETANERISWAQLNLTPPNPRSLNPKIPEALAKVILRTLAKDSAMRYQTTQELYEAACAAAGKSTEDPREEDIALGREIDGEAKPFITIPSNKLTELLIPLKPSFRFVHQPASSIQPDLFVGRDEELRGFVTRLLRSDGGAG